MDGTKILLRDTYNEIIGLTNKHKTLKTHIERWETREWNLKFRFNRVVLQCAMMLLHTASTMEIGRLWSRERFMLLPQHSIVQSFSHFHRVHTQLESTFHLIRTAIEHADIPQQRVTASLLALMRSASDFRDQSWMEALAPFVDYIHTVYQTKSNQTQFYENFSFRTDDFSSIRFNKQLKHILSIIVDSTSDSIVKAEEILAEEPELKDNENEWLSRAHNSVFDETRAAVSPIVE